MSEMPPVSFEEFRYRRQLEQQLRAQYDAYVSILNRQRLIHRKRKVLTVSAIVASMFLAFCSVAYAGTLDSLGVPGANILVSLRSLIPVGAVSDLFRADFLALVHALVWIVGIMDPD